MSVQTVPLLTCSGSDAERAPLVKPGGYVVGSSQAHPATLRDPSPRLAARSQWGGERHGCHPPDAGATRNGIGPAVGKGETEALPNVLERQGMIAKAEVVEEMKRLREKAPPPR